MSEQWRPVGEPFDARIEVSDLGRVRSSIRRVGGEPRILKPSFNTNGYPILRVTLAAGGQRTVAVHVLVARTFLGPRPEGLVVRHLDGDKDNAAVSNLRYGTPTENNLDTVRHGRNQQAAQTHCLRGHPFDEDNTIREGSSGRFRRCRTCAQRRWAARARRRREAREQRQLANTG